MQSLQEETDRSFIEMTKQISTILSAADPQSGSLIMLAVSECMKHEQRVRSCYSAAFTDAIDMQLLKHTRSVRDVNDKYMIILADILTAIKSNPDGDIIGIVTETVKAGLK